MGDVRVLLAEGHDYIGATLVSLLDAEPGISVVGRADDLDSALEECGDRAPDVVVIGYEIALRNGQDSCRRVRHKMPGAAILVLSPGGTGFDPSALIEAGASGCVALRETSPEEVIRVIRQAADGQQLSGMHGVRADTIEHAGTHGLSERELQVLQLMADGRSNREIGKSLWISETTVKTHVSHILHKLGRSDRTQAVLYAVGEGMVRLPR